MIKRKKERVDVDSPKINRSKNRILLPKITPVMCVWVATDPDMEIKIHKKLETAEGLTYQNDYVGVYQEVYPKPGKVNIQLKRELNQFLNQWLDNLATQGFYNRGGN